MTSAGRDAIRAYHWRAWVSADIPPETPDHNHSAYVAKPSLSQMCRQSATVRLLPNHWWASSCATSRSWVRRPSTWLRPKTAMPCASIGSSRSSSATTTTYSLNGYAPKNRCRAAMILLCRPKSCAKLARSLGGIAARWPTPRSTISYRPIWTLIRYGGVGSSRWYTQVTVPALRRRATKSPVTTTVYGDEVVTVTR